MKKLIAGLLGGAFFATSAAAGDLSEPVITEVDDTQAASSAPWLPLLLILGAVVLIGSQDDNSPVIK